MVLDRHSGRPRNLTRFNPGLPESGPKVLSSPLARLAPVQGYVPAYTLRVPFSALDFNGHVNNTEYVRWVVDALHCQLGRPPEIRAAQITYLAEAFEGDEIEVLVSRQDDRRIHIVERKSQGTDHADICIMECEIIPG
jgi:medium-chain acyl-[acyl-carrier-protein] hydrolase